MRVMCISNSPHQDSIDYSGKDVEVGEIYNVVKECWGFGKSGRAYPCYELAEFEPRYVWAKWIFAPLSEIDETELVNHKEKEYV